MFANVKVMKHENISGTSAKTGNDYDLDFIHFFDKDTLDKFRLMVSKEEVKAMAPHVGKEGVVSFGQDPKTEKLDFQFFKAASA